MKQYSKLDDKNVLPYIFHPRSTPRNPSKMDSLDLDVTVDADIVLGCRLFIAEKTGPTILYFHGNGETVEDYDYIAPLYKNFKINLLVFTYRGYGWSNGVPTVASMIKDSLICFDKGLKFLEENGLTGPVFLMGRSLGSVPAIDVCSQREDSVKGLFIDSGFSDTLPLLKNLGCSEAESMLSEEEGFGNRKKISTIKLPTLILHGAKDEIISIPQAERLQAFCGARTKKFFIIPGADHNSLIAVGGKHYFSTIHGFINDITGESSWRKRRKKYKQQENDD